MSLTLRTLPFALSATDEAQRTLTITASTDAFITSFEDDGEGGSREVREAIVEWSLERFLSSPVILAFHARDDFPIGIAEEVTVDETGLVLRIRFGSERANPKAEQAFQSVREGLLRTASVGFATLEILSEEIIDGIPHRRIKAELLETSLVPVPADPKALARSTRQAPVVKTDAKEDAIRLDFGTLGKAKLTPSGGARIPARFTRTGVLSYRMPNGSIRRELRHPDDVFHPESIASLRSATVTDNHPYQYGGIVDPDNWRELSVGHVEDPKRDSPYLSGDVVVQDGRVLDAINTGDRSDISAGYRCKFVFEPGTYNGEPYDVRQVSIRYNHVALLPPGKGRAGRDVSLRLDSFDAVCVSEEETMIIKLDGKDVDVPKEVAEHITRQDAAISKARQEAEEERKRSDKLRAEADAKEEELRKRKAREDEEEKNKSEEETERKIRSRVRLLSRAIRFIEGEEDEETKTDSLQDLSDREVMLRAIQSQSPDFKGIRTDGKPESDDYIRARFDLLGEVRADSVDALVGKIELAKKSGVVDPVAKAKADFTDKLNNAWKAKAS